MARINQWLDLLEARTLRERTMILLAALVVAMFFGLQFWVAPQLLERERGRGMVVQLEADRAQFELQIAKLETALSKDRRQEDRERLQRMMAESTALDLKLRQEQQVMISPELMPSVLEDLLDELPLALVKLEKLMPVIELDSDINGVPRVYRHGLRLELEGSYHDALGYLERLERLSWRLAWEALEIRMKAYPKARIILSLYTLSFDQEWLGV